MGKRVVLHAGSLGGGGAERVTLLMANALAARGHGGKRSPKWGRAR
jgi:hypothetical protein